MFYYYLVLSKTFWASFKFIEYVIGKRKQLEETMADRNRDGSVQVSKDDNNRGRAQTKVNKSILDRQKMFEVSSNSSGQCWSLNTYCPATGVGPEAPSDNNYFILINNNQAELIETLSSRCLKTNIFLNEDERINTIKSLIDLHNLETVIDYQKSDLTPGLFLRYNFFCTNNNLSTNNDIESKISILLNYYKKNKDVTAINLLIFFIEEYFYQLGIENNSKIFSIVAIKNNIIRNIKNFVKYNLNINSINNLINTEFKNV